MSDISMFSPWKVLYYRKEIEDILAGKIPPPVCMSIDPTNVCNQNCVWCFVKPYRTKNPTSLSEEVLFDFIRQIRGRVKAITYSGGGDPLMNPATIPTIVFVGHIFEQGLTTNGTGPWKDYQVRAIANACKFVRVSIDAASPEVYSKLHQVPKEMFWRATSFVSQLVEAKGGEVSVSFMICPENIKEVIIATKMYLAMGVNKLIFKFAYSDYPGINPGFSTQEFLESTSERIKEIIKLVKTWETDEFKIEFRHPKVFNEFDLPHQSKLYKRCYISPLNQAGLAADGNIHLCCDRRGDLILGNIKEQKFFNMWGGEKHKQIIKSIKLKACPTRCRITDMNQIVEAGFVDESLDWVML